MCMGISPVVSCRSVRFRTFRAGGGHLWAMARGARITRRSAMWPARAFPRALGSSAARLRKPLVNQNLLYLVFTCLINTKHSGSARALQAVFHAQEGGAKRAGKTVSFAAPTNGRQTLQICYTTIYVAAHPKRHNVAPPQASALRERGRHEIEATHCRQQKESNKHLRHRRRVLHWRAADKRHSPQVPETSSFDCPWNASCGLNETERIAL